MDADTATSGPKSILIAIIGANRVYGGTHLTCVIFSLHYIANREQQVCIPQCCVATSELASGLFHIYWGLTSSQAISRSALKSYSSHEWYQEYILTGVSPSFAKCFAKGVFSYSSSSARSQFIFLGTETGRVLLLCIISASHPSASWDTLTVSKRPLRACKHFRFHLWAGWQQRYNLLVIVLNFPPVLVEAWTQTSEKGGDDGSNGIKCLHTNQDWVDLTHTTLEAMHQEAIFHHYYVQVKRAECQCHWPLKIITITGFVSIPDYRLEAINKCPRLILTQLNHLYARMCISFHHFLFFLFLCFVKFISTKRQKVNDGQRKFKPHFSNLGFNLPWQNCDSNNLTLYGKVIDHKTKNLAVPPGCNKCNQAFEVTGNESNTQLWRNFSAVFGIVFQLQN